MKTVRILWICLAVLLSAPACVFSASTSLPMTIDYRLLRSLIISTAFTDPGDSAVVVDEGDGCVKITVSEPTVAEENALVRLEARVHVRAGLKIGGYCMTPVEWEGRLALFQRPMVDGETWTLSFKTRASAVYDKDHQPAVLGGIVWDLVKTRVYDYLSAVTIDLAPPMGELKSFLQPLFPRESHEKTKKMIDGMKPGHVAATPEAVRIEILTDVEEMYEKKKDLDTETIREEELEAFITAWEYWDAFLVNMILSLSRKPLTEDQRQTLLDVLLTTRYRFVAELSESHVQSDFVRERFISAWKQLSPVFRDHLTDRSSTNSLLGYVAFFTASDALTTLDKIGPTLGIEISRNGLVRLARLAAADKSVVLAYRPGVNVALRETLGLGPPLPPTESMRKNSSERRGAIGAPVLERLAAMGLSLVFSPAPAAADGPANHTNAMERWILLSSNVDTRLGKIKALLNHAADNALGKGGVGEEYFELYRRLVLSAAWQESCFRQFKWEKGKVIFLRSYNNSSVGIMQINERVWRGMYAPDHLRWDISYNARAGCEILHLYFHKYMLRKIRKSNLQGLDDETLAGIMYAMYNGGPAQFSKFLKRKKRGKLYLSDTLFMEKYIRVGAGRWEAIEKCL